MLIWLFMSYLSHTPWHWPMMISRIVCITIMTNLDLPMGYGGLHPSILRHPVFTWLVIPVIAASKEGRFSLRTMEFLSILRSKLAYTSVTDCGTKISTEHNHLSLKSNGVGRTINTAQCRAWAFQALLDSVPLSRSRKRGQWLLESFGETRNQEQGWQQQRTGLRMPIFKTESRRGRGIHLRLLGKWKEEERDTMNYGCWVRSVVLTWHMENGGREHIRRLACLLFHLACEW